MARDDDSRSGVDESPPVVMRTAGSLIRILFMLAAVVLAVLAITLQNIYKSSREDEITTDPEARTLVEYRIGLENARRASPIVPPPTLPVDHAQAFLDTLRADNAVLRKDNQDRAAAAQAYNSRPPP